MNSTQVDMRRMYTTHMAETLYRDDGCAWVFYNGMGWRLYGPSGDTVLATLYIQVEKDLVAQAVTSYLLLDTHSVYPARRLEVATIDEALRNAEFQARITHAGTIHKEIAGIAKVEEGEQE